MGVTPLTARVRPSLVDGLFYPSGRKALAALIDELLAGSPVPEGSLSAVISPHAGSYEYAGEVMAAAFRAIARRPVRTAVLIGPVHRDPEEAIYLPESDFFSTPLGEIPTDGAAAAALASQDPLFRASDIPHMEEHCLEVQLPFLARLFPGVSILPLLVGSASPKCAAALARALRLTFADRAAYTVLIVSANIASYMTGRDVAAENAVMEDLVARRDCAGIFAAVEKKRISACCAGGIAAVLSLGKGQDGVTFLARGSSQGKETDPTRIVHYAAVGIDNDSRPEG